MQESPSFPLISRDGVPIDPNGVNFEVTHRNGDTEEIVSITLRDLLIGLNMSPANDKSRSQAEVFASYAIQRGFRSEDEILERYRDVAPRQNSATKEWFSTARRLINIWAGEIAEERNRKATETMAEHNTAITVGQRTEANRLLPLLAQHEGDRLRSQLLDLMQVDEDEEGPQGAKMSRTIGRARAFLDLRDNSVPVNPTTQRQSRQDSQVNEFVSTQVAEDPEPEPF